MVTPGTFLKAASGASKEFFRSPGEAQPPTEVGHSNGPHSMVPIRSIGPRHSERIAAHLLSLNPRDRYLRFGYAANDEQVQRYVDGLDYARDDIFGIYNRKLELIAMAHLAFSTDANLSSCAEFGVSVVGSARGRGYGARLFERAVVHARNEGVGIMFIHALTENTVMLHIARKAGATIERDGSETEAYLKLPPADLDSRMSEIMQEQIAQTDYHLKSQAKQFWRFLQIVQDVRRGVQGARGKSAL
jgi:GNAT superfamily N-acetyltransferase